MKKPSVIISFILALAVSAVCLISLFSCNEKEEAGYSGILRLWNIDCFEGGKGSRASFLKSVAEGFEKRYKGIYVAVSTMTAAGYIYALESGNTPDMISFGLGVDISAYAVRLSRDGFDGGKIGNCQYAYPWCRGGYVLYSLQDDFSFVSAENTVISTGGNNIPAAAAALYGLSGEFTFRPSTSAYVEFLNGKYKYMLGTQRDNYRFISRGKEVFYKVLPEYDDLYQYISVLNDNTGAYGACLKFIDYLLSDEAQKKISSIGMVSDYYNCYTSADGTMYALQSAACSYTVGAFTGDSALEEVRRLSSAGLTQGQTKNLKNYLKTVA